MSSAAPRNVHIHTPRLILRQLEISDAAALQPLANDWDVAKQTANLPFPYGHDDASNFITTALQAAADSKEFVFAIVRHADSALIGLIGIIADVAPMETGYWLGRAYWGQGYASEALKAVQTYAREALDSRKLAAVVFENNPSSIRVLIKCGFQYQESWQEVIPSRGGARQVCRYLWVSE